MTAVSLRIMLSEQLELFGDDDDDCGGGDECTVDPSNPNNLGTSTTVRLAELFRNIYM